MKYRLIGLLIFCVTLALQVLEFNRNSTEFHARFTLYSENTESGESVTQVLGKDILNGNIPDVILCGRPDINASYEGKNSAEIRVSKLQSLGVCTDLLPLMEADGRYEENDFLPSVIQPRKVADGKLYSLIFGFSVHGLACASDTTGAEKLSAAKFSALAEMLTEGQALLRQPQVFTKEEEEKIAALTAQFEEKISLRNLS